MSDVPGFAKTQMTFEGATRDVWRAGAGPAVIVMTEVPGITPQVARFARWVAEAGFSVFMPQLLGTPMKEISPGYVARSIAHVCISR